MSHIGLGLYRSGIVVRDTTSQAGVTKFLQDLLAAYVDGGALAAARYVWSCQCPRLPSRAMGPVLGAVERSGGEME